MCLTRDRSKVDQLHKTGQELIFYLERLGQRDSLNPGFWKQPGPYRKNMSPNQRERKGKKKEWVEKKKEENKRERRKCGRRKRSRRKNCSNKYSKKHTVHLNTKANTSAWCCPLRNPPLGNSRWFEERIKRLKAEFGAYSSEGSLDTAGGLLLWQLCGQCLPCPSSQPSPEERVIREWLWAVRCWAAITHTALSALDLMGRSLRGLRMKECAGQALSSIYTHLPCTNFSEAQGFFFSCSISSVI